mgnify:CR=1 FL=1
MGICHSQNKKNNVEPKVVEEKPRKSVELKDVHESKLMLRRKKDSMSNLKATTNVTEEDPTVKHVKKK